VSIEREIGEIQATLKAQAESIREIKSMFSKMDEKLEKVVEEQVARKAGPRYLVALLSVAATAGALVSQAISWLKVI